MIAESISIEISFEKYWEEVYKAVSYGGFDSMAHIDFPKRYYKKCIWTKMQIRDILSAMVKNYIALEINTSSLRKGLAEPMPGKEFLEIYRDVGGINITIGTDAHSPEELASGYECARSLVYRYVKECFIYKQKSNIIKSTGSCGYTGYRWDRNEPFN